MNIQPKTKRRIGRILAAVFILLNIVAYLHAYNFTHFSANNLPRTREGNQFSIAEKAKMLLTGVNNPRPRNGSQPNLPFETITLKSAVNLEAWYLKTNELAKGTVLIFHGYGGVKASYIKNAEAFLSMGYNALLVDFRGSGGSEGEETTIGFKEADDVKAAYDYVQNLGEKHIYLNGSSMGAAAILRAVHVHKLEPTAVILQCPFGTMKEAVDGRFKTLGIPTFPMAGLLTFWGGVQNGFWAFNHNPAEYAPSVKCPSLLMWGEKDDRVSRSETDAIFKNLAGQKTLKIFPTGKHENYVFRFQEDWTKSVAVFLENLDKK